MAETQNDPLLPGYSFNAHLVAGLTPIEANGYLDFFIDRPLGMKVISSISPSVAKGLSIIRASSLSAGLAIFCCFHLEKFTTTDATLTPASGITSGFTFARAPTGRSG